MGIAIERARTSGLSTYASTSVQLHNPCLASRAGQRAKLRLRLASITLWQLARRLRYAAILGLRLARARASQSAMGYRSNINAHAGLTTGTLSGAINVVRATGVITQGHSQSVTVTRRARAALAMHGARLWSKTFDV